MMHHSITGIILTAGLSGRMNSFKPLLKLNDGKTFIQNIAGKLIQVCDEVIIVTGFKSNEIEENLNSIKQKEKLRFVFNENYQSGMFTSLQAGINEANSQWHLYHFVDQPSLPLSFYSDFIQQIDKQFNWIQPKYNNRKGHPILFDDFVKHKILEISIDKTLRDVTQDNSIKKKFWECDTDLIFQDLDSPKDYKRTKNNLT
ncbi:MAG: NTP transferase domain-containing protein [Melioribacteraceae bacterium]|nr:MAG: NTP transferase domain-containing protein [Melioribacteraceae bacterium]